MSLSTELIALVRIAAAGAALLLLPGHLCALALFPWTPQQDFAQEAAVAGSLGLAISIIIGTALATTASGFHLIAYLTVLVCCCIGFGAAALIRIWPTRRRVREQPPTRQPEPSRTPSLFGLPFLISTALILAIAMIGEHVPRSPQEIEQYTEFYLLDERRLIPSTAASVPQQERVRLIIGIINREQGSTDYRIEVRLADLLLWNGELRDVKDGAGSELAIDFRMPAANVDPPQLELFLFRSGDTSPYRYLHLGISDER